MDIPKGPQLKDADLSKLEGHDLYKLVQAVSLELRTVEMMYAEGEVSSDELLWVRDDAKTVQEELDRRGDTVMVETFSHVLERMVLKHSALFDAETVQKARETLGE